MSKKWVFLDANIYMHYLPIPDIDWVDLLELQDEDDVEVVVARINLRELDKQKDTNQNRHVTDRIRKFSKDFEERLNKEDWQITGKVSLHYYGGVPKPDLADKGLDPASNDDYLIAVILRFIEEHPDEDVVFFARDTNIRITAMGLGITAREMPDQFLAPAKPDPREVEIKRLKKEVQQLTNARPKLSVGVDQGGKTVSFFDVSIAPPTLKTDINDVWAREAQKYPALQTEYMGPLSSFPNTTNQEYNDNVRSYLRDFRTYLSDDLKYRNFQWQAFAIDLQVVNSGTAPAEDVDVFFSFPSGIDLFTEDQVPESPDRPEPPRPGDLFYRNSMLRVTSLIDQMDQRDRAKDAPVITGSEVRFHLTRVKHGTPISSPPLWAKFRYFRDADSFNFEYRLEAGNITTPVTGTINVKLAKAVPAQT